MASPTPPTAAVLLLCGLPGCGKSTLAAALAAEVRERGVATPVVLSVDDEEAAALSIASATSEDGTVAWNEAAWHAARAAVLGRCVDALRGALLSRAGDDGADGDVHAPPPSPNFGRRTLVIVDDNHYYASMRRPFYAAARDARAGFGVLWLDAPLEAALARDAGRTGRASVGRDIITRMAARFEPPDDGGRADDGGSTRTAALERADDAATSADIGGGDRWLRLDATRLPAELLPTALGYVAGVLLTPASVPPLPVPPPGLTGAALEAARTATAASAAHAADAGLRACVGRVMAAVKAAAQQGGASRLPRRDATGTAALASALAAVVVAPTATEATIVIALCAPATDEAPDAPRWTVAAVAAAANDARRAALADGGGDVAAAAAAAGDAASLAALFSRHLAAALAAAAGE